MAAVAASLSSGVDQANHFNNLPPARFDLLTGHWLVKPSGLDSEADAQITIPPSNLRDARLVHQPSRPQRIDG